MSDRFDVEIIRSEDHAEDTRRWVTFDAVLAALESLQEGDDMVVHHVGYAEPGVIYTS